MTIPDGNDAAKQAIGKAYLREMFELNPMWQASQILRRRREIWTGTSNPFNAAGTSVSPSASGISNDADDAVALRNQERVRSCLDTLQEQFYQLPDEKLSQYLRFVQSDKRPEIRAKVKRLSAIAELRNALIQFQRESTDAKFSYSLCQGLISPPAQAGALKEQYIESIIAEKRVSASCRMIRDFVSTHPEVYQLERDWFDLFLDPANQRQWSSRYSLSGRFRSITGNNRLNVLAFIGLFVFFAVVRAINSEPRSPAQRAPTMRLVRPAENQPVANGPVANGTDTEPNADAQALRPNAWIKEIQRNSSSPLSDRLPDIGFPKFEERAFGPPDPSQLNSSFFQLPPQPQPKDPPTESRDLYQDERTPGSFGGDPFP